MSTRGALVLCCLFLQSCSHDKLKISPCSINDFAQSDSEGFIEVMEQPIIVRNVRGKVTNEIERWPKNCPILFEIRRIGNGAETIQAYADGEGNFEIPRVAKGRYCFRAKVDGWRSVIGIIKVDGRADPKKAILIVMIPDS